MAIYHDAYLFSPDEFADFIQQHRKSDGNRDDLIKQAILFAKDKFVLELADMYGGWDFESISQELNEETDDRSYLARFIFMIYLYKYLGQIPNRIQGHGHHWLVIENSNFLSAEDKNLLIYGHPFQSFVAENQINQGIFGEHLSGDLHPFSTGGKAGYLSHAKVKELFESVQKVVLEQLSAHPDTHYVMVKAKNMLAAAIKAETGLCLIISG